MNDRPSAMSKAEFVDRFGGVFEHSPWIAEGAYAGGLGEAADNAEGLHRAMAAVLEKAEGKQKRALIVAHPDLAGRLAMAGALTEESTGEQTSAGLDRCSPEEFARFQELNDAYKARFGFPFVMAVKGRTRAEILLAFERRFGHDPETEFETALREIKQIALLRLHDLL